MTLKNFRVPTRIPNYGCTIEDNCKFWSYLFLYKDSNSFNFSREEECEICKDRVNLKIHHIVPFSNFGLHKVENLIILCHECHKKVHSGNLKIKKNGKKDLKWYKEYYQLLNISKKYDPIYEYNIFKKEVIDKIDLILYMLKQLPEKISHIPLEKYVIKLPIKNHLLCNNHMKPNKEKRNNIA